MGSNMSMEQQQDKIGDVVPSDGPDDRPEKHEIPFALALEKRSHGSFQPELREPADGGWSQLSRPAPNVMLAKQVCRDSTTAGWSTASPPPHPRRSASAPSCFGSARSAPSRRSVAQGSHAKRCFAGWAERTLRGHTSYPSATDRNRNKGGRAAPRNSRGFQRGGLAPLCDRKDGSESGMPPSSRTERSPPSPFP
jgi:hypothetical protein